MSGPNDPEAVRMLQRAPWLRVRWVGNPWRRPVYLRAANASVAWLLGVQIAWRRRWLPTAAYSKGWTAGYWRGYDSAMRGRRRGA